MENRASSRVANYLLRIALAALLGWVSIKFLLPCLAPFLIAFATAALSEPVVRYLTDKLNLRRPIASALCVLIILLSVVGFVLLVLTRLFDEAVGLLQELPELAAGLTDVMARVERAAQRFVTSLPPAVRDYADAALENLGSKLLELPTTLSAAALESLGRMAERAPATALFCVTYAIGSFFISISYPEVLAFIGRQLPERWREKAVNIKSELREGLGKWLRAELTLMAITFAVLTASFALMGVEYGAVIALVTAFIDALPVLGSGVVLLPWALALLLGGETGRALGLFMTYLVALLTRSCLEPKLLGDSFGVDPAAALLALYAGFKLCGVTGMVLFPIILMMVSHLNRKGYIKLWK